MKIHTPEIFWHNREAILAIDCKKSADDDEGEKGKYYKVATGGIEKDVKIWKIVVSEKKGIDVMFVSNLVRHSKTVNVLKFSPNGSLLASGDSEGVVHCWKLSLSSAPNIFSADEEMVNAENWIVQKCFRDHMGDTDVCDLCWSPDSKYLLSCSTDCSLIIWDILNGGVRKSLLKEHDKRFPLGVAWDPSNRYFVSLSNDRVMTVYSAEKFHRLFSLTNAEIPSFLDPSKKINVKIFHDSSLMSFVRRPSFTPDGNLFITPAGCIEEEKTVKYCTYVFSRYNLKKPLLILPSKDPTYVVSCCPTLFTLRPGEPVIFSLPFRCVFAVLSKTSIVLYDTQHKIPIAYISNIHYVNLTDCSWSADGKMMIVSSEDGYCTIITFENGELGEVYNGTYTAVATDSSIEQPTNLGKHSSPPSSLVKQLSPPSSMEVCSEKSIDNSSFVVRDKNESSGQNDSIKVVKAVRRVPFVSLSTPNNEVPKVEISVPPVPPTSSESSTTKSSRRVSFVTLL